MDKFHIKFALPELYESALSQLKAVCRFDPAKEMHARMLDDALAAHRDLADGAALEAVAAFFSPAAPRGCRMEIAGVALTCAAFEQLDVRNLTKVVVYAVSLRSVAASPRDLSLVFYRDIWENAYIEAALRALKSKLAARTGGVLSDSFGPGYYGMELEEMKRLARVLDFGRIGAEVLDNGMIRPPKSCAGIFFAVRDEALMPADSCRDCVGDKRGCAFCGRRA
jgi:hypothetical protein